MTTRQLWALAALRWRMTRSAAARRGFAALAAALPVTVAASIAAALLAPRARAFDVTLLVPTALLALAFLSLLAPLLAGGGTELFPADQLVAFPVSFRTLHLSSLLQVPLNIAWAVQVVGVLGLTAYAVGPSPYVVVALLVTSAYVVLVTVAGHTLSWLLVGVRQRRIGRMATWLLTGAVVAALAAVIATGKVGTALDNAPTKRLVAVLVGRGPLAVRRSFGVSLTLVALTVPVFLAGRWATAWTMRRTGDAGLRLDAQIHPRRQGAIGGSAHLRQQLAVDRAGVWRSSSLRRGLLVLSLLPGLVAAAAQLDWPSLVLLPGLVTAGAGLLFGVNAFCLDASGALWLASLPRAASVAFWCRTRVVAETCLLAAVVTLGSGALRTGRWPTAAEATAVVACVVVSTMWVVATCMHMSVRRPHRADLRGSRDTPAPPGVMTAYSLRLAWSTTLLGVGFSLCAQADAWGWAVLWALPLVLLSARRLLRTAAAWGDPAVRARVVVIVAGG